MVFWSTLVVPPKTEKLTNALCVSRSYQSHSRRTAISFLFWCAANNYMTTWLLWASFNFVCLSGIHYVPLNARWKKLYKWIIFDVHHKRFIMLCWAQRFQSPVEKTHVEVEGLKSQLLWNCWKFDKMAHITWNQIFTRFWPDFDPVQIKFWISWSQGLNHPVVTRFIPDFE